jgi:hypothetical protein
VPSTGDDQQLHRVDLGPALVDVTTKLRRLGVGPRDEADEADEVDDNPLQARPSGAVAADALAVLA